MSISQVYVNKLEQGQTIVQVFCTGLDCNRLRSRSHPSYGICMSHTPSKAHEIYQYHEGVRRSRLQGLMPRSELHLKNVITNVRNGKIHNSQLDTCTELTLERQQEWTLLQHIRKLLCLSTHLCKEVGY